MRQRREGHGWPRAGERPARRAYEHYTQEQHSALALLACIKNKTSSNNKTQNFPKLLMTCWKFGVGNEGIKRWVVSQLYKRGRTCGSCAVRLGGASSVFGFTLTRSGRW
jgi:hypothetical protein